MTFTDKILPYSIIELDLTSARDNLAQGLVGVCNTVTILTLGGGVLSLKLDSSSNDLIDASDGLKVEGNMFTDIYWTNAAQAGLTAKIYVAWVD